MSAASSWTTPPTYDVPSSSLTPYLLLPHLLTLTWLAYPILSLAFIAFRLLLSLDTAHNSVTTAKNDLLASCKAAETAATSAASMPRYLAIASNDQFADIVNGSLNTARETLVLTLTAMEGIINFIVDLYRSTILCFMELVVRGGLALLVAAVNELNIAVRAIADGLQSSIQGSISSANSAIRDAVNAINKVNPFSDISPPQIPVPDLSSLQNVTLPSSFSQALSNLNNSLPTVAQLKNEIESIIDTPFELLKKDINDTFASISFNSSMLPVPEQNRVAFCANMDLSVVDDLGHDFIAIVKIGIIILIVLALLLTGLNCLVEWYKWRCMKLNFALTRQAWMSDPTLINSKISSGTPILTMNDHNLMMLHADSTHPLLTRIAFNMTKVLHLSPSQHASLRWFFHYIFHPPAFACFLIGFLGLLSIELQLFAIGPLVAKYQERSVNTATGFSNLIATSINASMYNQSATYANAVNAQVDIVQTALDGGVFGWVNTTTVTLNDTINTFYDDVQHVVQNLFNGTILESTALGFVQCFIGGKVDAIENALTFLHDNLIINMPRVNDSILILSPDSVNEMTRPIATAAIGGGTSGKEGLIEKIVNTYTASLRKERLMFGIFIALWGVVVFMALCILFWRSYGKQLVEFWKRRKWQKEQRGGIDGLIVPFRMHDPTPMNDKASVGARLHLPSFTPLPSPLVLNRDMPLAPSHPTEPSTITTAEGEGGRWAATFRERLVAGRPNKLVSIGRKVRGKERFVDDPVVMKDEPTSVTKDTAWFGRDKKKPSVDPVSPHPKLHISISRPSTEIPQDDSLANTSRWSHSPIATTVTSPWKNLMKKIPPPTEPPKIPTMSPPPRLISHNIPVDVNPKPDVSFTEQVLFAPPIHHGFEDSRYPKMMGTRARPPTPVPLHVATAVGSPRHLQSQQMMLMPPPMRPSKHRRVSSSPGGDVGLHLTSTRAPVPRLLANVHGEKNPFVTPFDDEHKVEIKDPVRTRKSVTANPFEAMRVS